MPLLFAYGKDRFSHDKAQICNSYTSHYEAEAKFYTILTQLAYIANGTNFFLSATIHWVEMHDTIWRHLMTLSFPLTMSPFSLTLDSVT